MVYHLRLLNAILGALVGGVLLPVVCTGGVVSVLEVFVCFLPKTYGDVEWLLLKLELLLASGIEQVV